MIRILFVKDDHEDFCDDNDGHDDDDEDGNNDDDADDDDDNDDDDDDDDDHLVSVEKHAATKEAREASGKEKADQG